MNTEISIDIVIGLYLLFRYRKHFQWSVRLSIMTWNSIYSSHSIHMNTMCLSFLFVIISNKKCCLMWYYLSTHCLGARGTYLNGKSHIIQIYMQKINPLWKKKIFWLSTVQNWKYLMIFITFYPNTAYFSWLSAHSFYFHKGNKLFPPKFNNI